MRRDTPLGPVWLVPDSLPEEVARHTVRLELGLNSLDGIVAMHTGPEKGGAWVVRAPRAALEEHGYAITAAAELPVEEGTCWPPISEEGKKIIAETSDAG
jgi:hypothetical protein